MLTFEPVVALILAAAMLGESLNAGQWLGAIAVLGGVLLLASPRSASVRTGLLGRRRSRNEARS